MIINLIINILILSKVKGIKLSRMDFGNDESKRNGLQIKLEKYFEFLELVKLQRMCSFV